MITAGDLQALWLSLKLAATSTVILLALGIPLAWWLRKLHPWVRAPMETLVALPLVLPPTVLGFYLLMAFAPDSPLAGLWRTVTGSQLAFSFEALVIGSVIYSLPFVVQPLQIGFAGLRREWLETAASLGAGNPLRWYAIILPLSRRSLLVAATLGFAHCLGEFGVVLMIGGNIPGETRVVSIALFEQVETLNQSAATALAGLLLGLSFALLLPVYLVGRDFRPQLVPRRLVRRQGNRK